MPRRPVPGFQPHRRATYLGPHPNPEHRQFRLWGHNVMGTGSVRIYLVPPRSTARFASIRVDRGVVAIGSHLIEGRWPMDERVQALRLLEHEGAVCGYRRAKAKGMVPL